MLVLNNVSAAVGRARVRVVSGVELCLAVWAALAPEQEPLSQAAHRMMASMPAGPRRTLAELNERLPQWPLRVLNTFYRLGGEDLGESLAAFAAEKPHDVARDVLRGCLPPGTELPSATCADTVEQALSGAGRGADVVRRLRRTIVRPHQFVVQVVEVLTAFANAGFAHWWSDQQGGLVRLGASLDSRVSADFVRGTTMISSRVVSDPALDRLTFLGGSDLQIVDCARFAGVDVLPSCWLRRRVVLHQAPGRVGVGVWCGQPLHHEFDQLQVPVMLTALADERRFEILRLCLLRARTTSELAPLLGITEGPVSRHLKELERGGLVSSERFGKQVRYSTAIEMLALLGQRLQRLPQQVWTEHAADRLQPVPA